MHKKKNAQKAGKDKPQQSCSITHTYSEGSCFTLNELQEIAKQYNDAHSDKIKLYDEKPEMINALQDKLKEKCSDQTCWATLSFINNNELSMAFKAKGPAGQYDWLSTTEINDCMERYMRLYSDFLFVGAVPIDIEDLEQFGIGTLSYDKVYELGYKKIGIVFNLDKHDQSGSHWVAFYVDLDKNQIYYSDSASNQPEIRVKKLVKKLAELMYKKKYPNKKMIELDAETYMNESGPNAMEKIFDIRYNTMKHQFGGSECGIYSMNFIIRLLRGDTFDEIHKSRIPDSVIHLCRGKYLNNMDNIIKPEQYNNTTC